ncbi:MAG: hypothetical protein HYZ81_11125 [Nitrospinae bacterium]|nr:hypothetical protein [Nitrospinota bacterium]
MTSIEDDFTHIRQLMRGIPDGFAERYEAHILSVARGSLRIRLRFSDQALLEISDAPVIVGGETRWLSYRYRYQDGFGRLVFRYDNAPHHPEVPTYPDHTHTREEVVPSSHPTIEQVLREVEGVRRREAAPNS